MEGDLECTKCGSIVYVESNWYGLSRRFKFKCKCNELDILSNASYTETFDEAISRKKEWKQYLTTSSSWFGYEQLNLMLARQPAAFNKSKADKLREKFLIIILRIKND